MIILGLTDDIKLCNTLLYLDTIGAKMCKDMHVQNN